MRRRALIHSCLLARPKPHLSPPRSVHGRARGLALTTTSQRCGRRLLWGTRARACKLRLSCQLESCSLVRCAECGYSLKLHDSVVHFRQRVRQLVQLKGRAEGEKPVRTTTTLRRTLSCALATSCANFSRSYTGRGGAPGGSVTGSPSTDTWGGAVNVDRCWAHTQRRGTHRRSGHGDTPDIVVERGRQKCHLKAA